MSRRQSAAVWLVPAGLVLAAVALAAACSRGPDGGTTPDYLETGDLPELLHRGYLRVLMPPREVQSLPRRGYTLDLERDLIDQLARELRLQPVLMPVVARDRMLDDLESGRGDLVVARLTVTDSRSRRFAFSVPIDYAREVLVCRTDGPPVETVQDLAGREVAVRGSSSYAETLRALQGRVPDLRVLEVPETTDTEELLYQVAQGKYEATVADDDIFLEVSSYLDGLHAPLELTEERPIAWAMRSGNPGLKQAVDQFLYHHALTRHADEVRTGDLDAIRQRRVLRVLTVNTAANYFLYRGRQMGFEYEFASNFARALGCRVQVVVPPRADLLIPWLLQGKGDLVAASMAITPARERLVAFSTPYNYVSEIVVTRADDVGLRSVADLADRSIAVRPSSSYHASLAALDGMPFEIVAAPEEITTENLIRMVARSEYDLTVADSNILDIELTYRDDVRGAFALGQPQPVAWMLRPANVELLQSANDYIRREYRGTLYNVLKRKYFENSRQIAVMAVERPARHGRLSPYDDLFRAEGRRIEVDWRLLAAQAYEESRFDPDARSWAGAMGVMQVLPRTARELGVEGDLHDPAVGIRAGAEYLRWLLERFDNVREPAERMRFALAAYNAGRGHVLDGRRLAAQRGLDPDMWFDHVERVLPLLSLPEHAGRARFGYCRCRQPVAYVRNINERYLAYTQAVN